MSDGRVLLEILVNGPLSRVELGRRLGLSNPSLTRLTKPLISAGLLVEGNPRGNPMGRPSLPLDIDARARYFAGVHLTRGTCQVVVTDLRGTVVAVGERPLGDPGPERVAGDIAAELAKFEPAFSPLTAIGVALAGRTPDGRTVAEAGFPGWQDVPLADLVEAAAGRPVVVAGDVAALTQAEHWFGAGRGLRDFAVITLGATVGLGVVQNDRLVAGAHGGAGTIGHQFVMDSPATCPRGHRGCADALLTTGSLGPEKGPEKMAEALGLLAASVANFLDPQKIVIAGEGAALGVTDRDAMLRAYRAQTAGTPIEVAPFTVHDRARGAAAGAMRAWATS